MRRTMNPDMSLLPSATTLIIIALGMVQGAPLANNQHLDWSSIHAKRIPGRLRSEIYSDYPEQSNVRMARDVSPIQTLMCLQRGCGMRNPDSSTDCTWQKCQSLLRMTSSPQMTSSNAAKSSMMSLPQDYKVASSQHKQNILSEIADNFERTHKRRALKRRKRWTYIDPLQVCIAQKCQGLSEVHFYQCVYQKCIGHK